jgi:predicted CXXCH cytochrome family protein
MSKTFLIALLVLLWIGQAWSLEIVYPEDKTYFIRSDFLIIKGGEAPRLDGMSIEINGAKSDIIDISGADYRAAFADFLILQPEFDAGKNRIAVEGYAAGKKVSSAAAEVYYLDGDPSAIPPAGLKPFTMHLPEKEKLCAPCHNMDPDKAELRAESEELNPCASCHRRMLNEEHVHGPAGVYRCGYCHSPESRPARYRVRAHDAELCNECHLDKVKEFRTNKFVHGPVGAGLCSVCHDSHASAQVAQLLAPINELCLGCHDGVTKDIHVVRGVGGKGHPLKGVPDPSNPGRELSCASCHDPHGGNAAPLFQRGIASRFSLCQICHLK